MRADRLIPAIRATVGVTIWNCREQDIATGRRRREGDVSGKHRRIVGRKRQSSVDGCDFRRQSECLCGQRDVLDRGTDERLYGGLGLAALAVSLGARIIRTHDVGPTRDALCMVSAVLQGCQASEAVR